MFEILNVDQDALNLSISFMEPRKLSELSLLRLGTGDTSLVPSCILINSGMHSYSPGNSRSPGGQMGQSLLAIDTENSDSLPLLLLLISDRRDRMSSIRRVNVIFYVEADRALISITDRSN